MLTISSESSPDKGPARPPVPMPDENPMFETQRPNPHRGYLRAAAEMNASLARSGHRHRYR